MAKSEGQIAGDILMMMGMLFVGLVALICYPFSLLIPKPRLKIPLDVRFEHTYVIGGSGHGKTQLLQHLIATEDLPAVLRGERSLIVIDSQGDMLEKILRLAAFSPDRDELSERLIYLNPADVLHPPALNLFDFGRSRLNRYSPAEREKFVNGTVSLYEYLFGALLGAELTARQGTLFRYLARLLMQVPGATIYTLIDFMEEPDRIRPYLGRLDAPTRRFLETQFFSHTYDGTRQQIITRLYAVLSNNALARMFTHKQSKVDLFAAMNRGSIILINTAKDVLKQEGCEIFGRFMISLISQATQERAALPASRRLPTLVYIDEAQDYFDSGMETLVSQGRKYNVGLVIAHQNLGQFTRALRDSVMASTAIKYAGGVSGADATALAREMKCDPDFLMAMQKGRGQSHFALFVRNITPEAVEQPVPFGTLERLPRQGTEEFKLLMSDNRQRYCGPIDDAMLWGPGPGGQHGFRLGRPKTI
jgi:Type IV secretion-system coupling protein DNA-binding domain